jgi:hypothetical protein
MEVPDECIEEPWDDIIGCLVDESDQFSTEGQYQCELQSQFSNHHFSKKRKPNPDKFDIAKATADALSELGVDPNSQEGKLKKRQIRNRISAQFHRDRKNQHIVELEIQLAEKSQKIEELTQNNFLLRNENNRLKLQVLELSKLRSNTETDTENVTLTTTNMTSSSNSVGSQSPDLSLGSTSHSSSSLSPNTVNTTNIHTMNNMNSIPINQHHMVNPNYMMTNPFLKSMSFICILCVVCLCNWTDYSSSSTIIKDNQPTASNNINNNIYHHQQQQHRKLFEIPSLTIVETNQNGSYFQTLSESSSSSSSSLKHDHNHDNNHDSSSNNNNNNYLRRRESKVNETMTTLYPYSPTASTSFIIPTTLYSRDLIPFPITKTPQEDWQAYQKRINAISSSQIIMQTGFALFDPAFSNAREIFSSLQPNKELWNDYLQMYSPAEKALMPLYAHHHPTNPEEEEEYGEEENLAEEHNHTNQKKTKRGIGSEEKHWPAIQHTNTIPVLEKEQQVSLVPLSYSEKTHLHSHHDASATARSTSKMFHNSKAEEAAKLVAESNIVTITLPATLIKFGSSLQDSEPGTVDSILKMFNMTNDSSFTAPRGLSVQDTWIELNCIVVGTKIIWNLPVNNA